MGFLACLNKLLYSLFTAISRLAAALSGNTKLHSARFAQFHELAGLIHPGELTNEPSLTLGITHLGNTLAVRSTRTRRELGNLLIVAPTRGGKGLLAVSELLTWPHSVVVNDIKGDLFTQTAGYRSTLGPVYCVDPTGVGHAFDPLFTKHTEDELYSAATALLYKHDERQPIFTQRATVMLTQIFLAAREEGRAPLPYTREIIRSGLTQTASRLNAISPELATQFLNVPLPQANLGDGFLISSWGTLDTRMRPLLTETVVRSLARADFEPSGLMRGDTPVTVYLRWRERDLLALAPVVRLIWGTIIDELITIYDRQNGQNCAPVLLLIDEAGRTAIPMLADSATTVVGRGLTLWIAVQSLSQLDAVYGKTYASVIRDNMETQLYYRPANQQTAEYLERCLGKTSAYAHSQTKREGTRISQGLVEQAVPLLTAGEIKQMGDEDIIGFHRRLPPFMAKRMDWRKFPRLCQRHNLVPPTLPVLPAVDTGLSPRGESTLPLYIDPDSVHSPYPPANLEG